MFDSVRTLFDLVFIIYLLFKIILMSNYENLYVILISFTIRFGGLLLLQDRLSPWRVRRECSVFMTVLHFPLVSHANARVRSVNRFYPS